MTVATGTVRLSKSEMGNASTIVAMRLMRISLGKRKDQEI
jgi:hypothetical protein